MQKNIIDSTDVVKNNASSTKTESISIFHKNQWYSVDTNDVLWVLNFFDALKRELEEVIVRNRESRKRKKIMQLSLLIAATGGLTFYAVRKFLRRKSRKKK